MYVVLHPKLYLAVGSGVGRVSDYPYLTSSQQERSSIYYNIRIRKRYTNIYVVAELSFSALIPQHRELTKITKTHGFNVRIVYDGT